MSEPTAPRETVDEIDRIGAYTMGHVAGDAIAGFWDSLTETKMPRYLAVHLVKEWTGAQWRALFPSVVHVCARCGEGLTDDE